MAEKSVYRYRVEPEAVDFTMHATISALGAAVLNAAGVDAHGKGFGVDALTKHNCSWVLSRLALELDRRPAQYDDYRIVTWISDYGRVLSTRNFVLEDAAGLAESIRAAPVFRKSHPQVKLVGADIASHMPQFQLGNTLPAGCFLHRREHRAA